MTTGQKESMEAGWRPRLTALADAQSRYFYLLGAFGALYLALFAGQDMTPVLATGQLTPVPLQISTGLVLATGPIVLGFLIQAVTGTIVAIENAAWRMAVLEEVEFEREHTAPSAIDLAFYTTERSPVAARAAGLIVYPAYLTAFLVEGSYLIWWLSTTNTDDSTVLGGVKWALVVLGFALLMTSIPRLWLLWMRKVSHAYVIMMHRHTPVSVSRAMTTLADISDSLRGAGRKVESRFENRRYRLYVDDEQVAGGRSLQELTVRTREWAEHQATQASE